MVSISPNGFIPYCLEPLSTTIATPKNATMEPIHDDTLIVSLNRTIPSIIVKIGAQQIINETFEANVIPRAEFSAIKYSDPPVIPAASIISSSFRVFAHSLLWQSTSVQKYAIKKRIMKISTGLNPLMIKDLVDTNVTPHTIMVANAITL